MKSLKKFIKPTFLAAFPKAAQQGNCYEWKFTFMQGKLGSMPMLTTFKLNY